MGEEVERQNLRHGLKEELKATKHGEEIHKGEPEQGEIHGEDTNAGEDLMFETSNEAINTYVFTDDFFYCCRCY